MLFRSQFNAEEEDEEDTEEASGIAENNSIDLGDVVVHLDDYDK